MANKENSGWVVLFTATLWLIPMTAPAHAHIADGENVLTDWHWRWDILAVLFVFATLYIRGWLRLKAMGGEAKVSQVVFYVVALVAIGAALLSPLDDLASYLLIAHMVQHELLMMLAPPFILLANPVPVLWWSLGRDPRLQAGHLLARHSPMRRVRDLLGWMPVAWSLYVINLWAWHYPALYDAALRVPWIHDLEHVLFFLTALVFWWPVIQPQSRPAPIQHGLRILYPHYQTALRLWDLTPREDQIGGGIVMFAVGSTTYAVAILILVNALLGEGRRKQSTKRTLSDGAEKVEGRI
jgi:putative membrane protein